MTKSRQVKDAPPVLSREPGRTAEGTDAARATDDAAVITSRPDDPLLTLAEIDRPAESRVPSPESRILRVYTLRPEGFRRAGLVFGRQPTLLARERLTDEQVAALKAEPCLAVEEVNDFLPSPESRPEPVEGPSPD